MNEEIEDEVEGWYEDELEKGAKLDTDISTGFSGLIAFLRRPKYFDFSILFITLHRVGGGFQFSPRNKN